MDDESATSHRQEDMQATVERQSEEIKAQAARLELQEKELGKLRRSHEEEHSANELRDALMIGMIAGNITSPVNHHQLLEMIVETASHVIGADATALFLLDERTNELTFEIAQGGGGAQLKKFRVPLGQGIAGYVAESQQPLAVSDVVSDERWHREIGSKVGYVPKNILCVPMFKGDRLTGVLELCDKIGADSFGIADIETLTRFANQAAVAIELSRAQYHMSALIVQMLEDQSGITKDRKEHLKKIAYSFSQSMDESEEYRQRFDLARLVQAIVWQGENEFRACQTILRGFSDYLSERPFGADWGMR
jgi:GAF domain-containing protein